MGLNVGDYFRYLDTWVLADGCCHNHNILKIGLDMAHAVVSVTSCTAPKQSIVRIQSIPICIRCLILLYIYI